MLASKIEDKRSVFLGNADSFTIISKQLDINEIIAEINYAVLLYDYAVLPAAFLWQSKEMNELYPLIDVYLEAGIILPMIRDYSITSDIYDYYSVRYEETTKLKESSIKGFKSAASEIVLPEHKKIAKKINRNNKQLYSDTGSTRSAYQCNWIDDLNNEIMPYTLNHILNEHLDNESSLSLNRKLKVLVTDDLFSRSMITEELINLSLKTDLLYNLVNRTSYLYLSSCSSISNSDLLLPSQWESQYIGKEGKAHIKEFIKFMELFGVNKNDFAKLTQEERIQIKYSEEFKNIRDVFFEFLEIAENANKELEDAIVKQTINKFKKEKLVNPICKAIIGLAGISAVVFFSILTEYHDILDNNKLMLHYMIAGGGFGANKVISKLKYMNDIINDKNFIEFKDYMFQKRYRNKATNYLYKL